MFLLFKKPLLILLLLATTAGGAYFFIKKEGKVLGQEISLENLPKLSEFNIKLPFKSDETSTSPENENPTQPSDILKNSVDLTSQQLQTLSENGSKVKDQLIEFTSQIKESSQSTPLHERAFEYGQYLYCQQVIKEYED